MVAPLSWSARHCTVQAGHPESPYPTRALFFCLLRDFSKLHQRLASRQVPGCGVGQRICKRTLCIFCVRAPSPQESSNTEYPAQKYGGSSSKGDLAATHLVRFKNKTKQKTLTFVPPDYIPIPPIPRVWGAPVGTFKTCPLPRSVALSGCCRVRNRETQRALLGRTHLHAALRLLSHFSTRGACGRPVPTLDRRWCL